MGPASSPADVMRAARVVAVVGASDDHARPARGVMEYLLAAGIRVVPVHPAGGEMLGLPVARSLEEVAGPVDVVDVFRRSETAPLHAREAVAIGARALWLQPGCVSEEARRIGLAFVEDRCTRLVHRDEVGGAVAPTGRRPPGPTR
jgi:hypothetical protein